MKPTVLEQVAPGQRAAVAALTENYVLNVAVVYDHESTRAWARETCDQISKLAGDDAVRCTWWRLADLSQPAVLAGAVSKGMRADVLVVAIRAAKLFPLPFYVWIDSWLPHRFRRAGALVALVATTDGSNGCSHETNRYLRAVARRGHLDFLPQERNLSATAPGRGQTQTPAADLLARPLPNDPRLPLYSYSARQWRMEENEGVASFCANHL